MTICKLISLECFTPGKGKIVPRRNVNNYEIKPHSSQERPTKIHHHHDRHRALTQTYNNCEETHHSGGVLSAFVFPLIAIAHQLQL